MNQADVVMQVTGLTGEYSQPILAERRSSRATAPAGNLAEREETAVPAPPEQIPAPAEYPGSEYCGEAEVDLGLESREEFRRLQDYLAHYSQSPTPVSAPSFTLL